MTRVTGSQVIPVDPLRHSQISRYVRARRCKSGGYCFYRLDEPNAGDTFHALKILSLLGENVHDDETAAFLHGLQDSDGSYASYAAALSAGYGLRLLGESPRYDLTAYLSRTLPRPDPDTQVTGSYSLFEPLYTWSSLFTLYHVPIPEGWDRQLTGMIRDFQAESGGFGYPVPTLRDTWQASEVLIMLKYPRERLGISGFIQACEDPEFGYLGRVGSRPAYLEHLYAGLRLSALLTKPPRYPGACRVFIDRCAHHSGGFVRSVFGGTPTLEFTAMAVESLSILGGITYRLNASCR